MEVSFRTDLKDLAKGMNEVARRQIPFATAQALTATARHAQAAWQEEIEDVLDRPTPFTVRSVGVRGARKSALVSTVFVKNIAANYLQPFVVGGPHYLGQKKGLLTPKATKVNQYGNLPKSRLATLKARKGVFVGPMKVRGGTVSGVWQRVDAKRRGPNKGPAGLKLLIRFSDPLPVTQRLRFLERTEAAVRQHFDAEFERALAAAIATAR